MSASAAASRGALSKNTSVAGTLASSVSAWRRAESFADGGAHQLEAGIGDEGRSRIGDKGHRLATAHALDEQRPHALGIVLMIGQEWRANAVAREELGGDARILAGDGIDALQRGERAQGDVV